MISASLLKPQTAVAHFCPYTCLSDYFIIFSPPSAIIFCLVFTVSRLKNWGSVEYIKNPPVPHRRTAVAQWLRYCATNRKVAVSIPAGVSGIFMDIKWLRYCVKSRKVAVSIPAGVSGIFIDIKWLRCCATNRKVAGSIPAGVSEIFH